MGWLRGPLPRFVSVQAEGCAPVVRAWRAGAETTSPWENPVTHAAGLRVPSPFGGRQMLRVIRDTGGEALSVSEAAIQEAQQVLAGREGLWTGPEAAATVAALLGLKERGALYADARVVLVLTGAGIKNEPPPLPPPVHLTGSEDEIVERARSALAAWGAPARPM